MRASYTFFPESRYVQRAFRGAVTYAKLRYFTARQLRDPRMSPHYASISDFTQATLHLTDLEVRNFAEWLSRQPNFSAGKRALVVTNARNFAIATLFEKCLAEHGVEIRCFQTRSAATLWIKSERTGDFDSVQTGEFESSVAPTQCAVYANLSPFRSGVT